MERIQGLPGKAETISNVIINELDNSVKRTQAIILSSSRETAQAIQTLVSASAASASVTIHLSVGRTDIHEEVRGLKERPHIVIGTMGRITHMLKRRIINPADIRILCVDHIQYLLSARFETEFAELCKHLPNDIKVVLLSNKIRYNTPHDLSSLFGSQPLHFLVREDPAPEPSAVSHNAQPISVGSDQNEDATRNAVRAFASY